MPLVSENVVWLTTGNTSTDHCYNSDASLQTPLNSLVVAHSSTEHSQTDIERSGIQPISRHQMLQQLSSRFGNHYTMSDGR